MTVDTGYKLPEVKDCMGYENLGSVEIRMSTLDSFIEYAKEYQVDTIWSCYGPICNKFTTAKENLPDFERQKPHSEIFFFVRNKEIFSVESEGYRLLSDYIKAKEMGFADYRAQLLVQYISKRYIIESVASLYYDAVEYGFRDFKEFDESYRFYDEFQPAAIFRKENYLSKVLGFRKKYDWEIAKTKGFDNGPDYYDAISLGIKNSCEYEDYKILTEKMSEYGFESPYKFHIFHIISRLRGGQIIKLNELKDKLRDESYYYSKDWYGQERYDITTELLRSILTNEKHFSKIGKLIINSEDEAYSLYRNDTIFVDGSNVAWNNGSRRRGDSPYARNIKAVVGKLKEIGFNKVLVLCDNNLYKDVTDKDVYKELSRMEILYVVSKGNTADEWLLRFKEDKDKFIVSNDKYRKYSGKYPDIRKHRIGFQVIGEEARFDEKIFEVVDGILPENKLPRLCYQSKDKLETDNSLIFKN